MTNPYFNSATFRAYFLVHFQALLMKTLRYKYENEQIATRDNGNVQSHDQEESKLNSTINTNSGAHTLKDDKIIKSPLNENNLGTIQSIQHSNKDLITSVCRISTMWFI